MTTVALALTLFTASWVGIFPLGGWFRIPNVLFILTILSYLAAFAARGFRPWPRWRHAEDLLIAGFLVVQATAALVRPNDGTLNYLAAYLFVFGGLYFGGKTIMGDARRSTLLLRANSWGVLFSAGFVCVSIVLVTLTGIDIEAMIPRVREPTALYGGLVRRAYGLATEPGILAQYLNVMGALAFYWIFMRSNASLPRRLLQAAVIAAAWIATFSAAGFACLAAAVAIALPAKLLARKESKTLFTWLIVAVVLTPMILVISQSISLPGSETSWTTRIISKLTFSGGAGEGRLERWTFGLALVRELPLLGMGPGYLSYIHDVTVNSWYLQLLIETGPIALACVVAFLVLLAARMARDPSSVAFFSLVGLIAGALHLLVISTFFYPSLWLAMGMYFAVSRESGVAVAPAHPLVDPNRPFAHA